MSTACPRCGGRMRKRVNRETREAFWGCAGYPRCKGTAQWEEVPVPGHLDPRAEVLATLLDEAVRERDQFRAGYEALMVEVRQLRRLKARQPVAPADVVVRELTRLIAVCHPDKWGGESGVATALTRELLALRERLMARG